MKVRAIHHVQMTAGAGSEDALRAFYCGLLGLREIPKLAALQHRGGLWLDCGNLQLHIGIDRPDPLNHPSRRHVAFEVDDLDHVRKALQGADAAIEEDTAPLDGPQRCYARDPAGNRVEFLQYVR